MGDIRHRRQAVVITICILLLGASVAAFRVQDLADRSPTPIPEGYRQVALGSPLLLSNLHPQPPRGQPILLHFFNPACPCSRFGLNHLRDLHHKFRGRISFFVVLPPDIPDALRQYRQLKLPIPAMVDTDGHLAAATGAFSTPQAAIIDASSRLFFRGNYNSSRYCTDPDSAYVHLALNALLRHQPLPLFPSSATVAYGCPFPRRQIKSQIESPAP